MFQVYILNINYLVICKVVFKRLKSFFSIEIRVTFYDFHIRCVTV